jgi:hypothetical protein
MIKLTKFDAYCQHDALMSSLPLTPAPVTGHAQRAVCAALENAQVRAMQMPPNATTVTHNSLVIHAQLHVQFSEGYWRPGRQIPLVYQGTMAHYQARACAQPPTDRQRFPLCSQMCYDTAATAHWKEALAVFG